MTSDISQSSERFDVGFSLSCLLAFLMPYNFSLHFQIVSLTERLISTAESVAR